MLTECNWRLRKLKREISNLTAVGMGRNRKESKTRELLKLKQSLGCFCSNISQHHLYRYLLLLLLLIFICNFSFHFSNFVLLCCILFYYYYYYFFFLGGGGFKSEDFVRGSAALPQK